VLALNLVIKVRNSREINDLGAFEVFVDAQGCTRSEETSTISTIYRKFPKQPYDSENQQSRRHDASSRVSPGTWLLIVGNLVLDGGVGRPWGPRSPSTG